MSYIFLIFYFNFNNYNEFLNFWVNFLFFFLSSYFPCLVLLGEQCWKKRFFFQNSKKCWLSSLAQICVYALDQLASKKLYRKNLAGCKVFLSSKLQIHHYCVLSMQDMCTHSKYLFHIISKTEKGISNCVFNH